MFGPQKYLVYLAVALCLCINTSCNKKKKDKTPPVLSHAFVDTSLTREFLVFGYELHPTQLNPTYEIVTTNINAKVYAATAGRVTRAEHNGGTPGSGQDDYEIFIEHKPNSIYIIIYDHVKNLEVSVGDHVEAGDILGEVGDYNTSLGWGRAELQINNNSTSLAECPADLGTSDFNTAFETALVLHNNNSIPPHGKPTFPSVCLIDQVSP